MKTLSKIVLIIASCTFLLSCSKKDHIGKWQDNDSISQLELTSDGKLHAADGSSVKSGKYTVTDDGKLKMQMEEKGITIVAEFSMTVGDKDMTLINEKGKAANFKRIELIE